MDRRVLPLKSLTYSFQISPAFPLSVSKCLHNPAVTWHDKGNGSLCQGLQLPVPCPSHADRFQVLPRAQGWPSRWAFVPVIYTQLYFWVTVVTDSANQLYNNLLPLLPDHSHHHHNHHHHHHHHLHNHTDGKSPRNASISIGKYCYLWFIIDIYNKAKLHVHYICCCPFIQITFMLDKRPASWVSKFSHWNHCIISVEVLLVYNTQTWEW